MGAGLLGTLLLTPKPPVDRLATAPQSPIRRTPPGSAPSTGRRQGALPCLDPAGTLRPQTPERRPPAETRRQGRGALGGLWLTTAHRSAVRRRRSTGSGDGQIGHRWHICELGARGLPEGSPSLPARKRLRPLPLPAETAFDLRKRWSGRQDLNLRPLDPQSTHLSPHPISTYDNPATLPKLPNSNHFAIQGVIECKFLKLRCIVSVFYRCRHLVSQSGPRLKKLVNNIRHPLRRKRKFTAPTPLQGCTRFAGNPLAIQARLPDGGLINVQNITIRHNKTSSGNGGVRTRGTRHPASIREPLQVENFTLIQRRLNRHRPNEVCKLTHAIPYSSHRGSRQQQSSQFNCR